MKKFFAMFAFAATIVLGALTLASCQTEDDNLSNRRHKFALEAQLTPGKTGYEAQVADLEKEVNAVLTRFNDEALRRPMTEEQASRLWQQIIAELGEPLQAIANKAWKNLKDQDFVLSLIMREDDVHVYQRQNYTPSFLN